MCIKWGWYVYVLFHCPWIKNTTLTRTTQHISDEQHPFSTLTYEKNKPARIGVVPDCTQEVMTVNIGMDLSCYWQMMYHGWKIQESNNFPESRHLLLCALGLSSMSSYLNNFVYRGCCTSDILTVCGIVGRVAQQSMCVFVVHANVYTVQTISSNVLGKSWVQGFHVTQIRAAKLCQEGNSGRYITVFANLDVTESRNFQNVWKFRDFIFKVSTLLSCMQNVFRNESLPDMGRKKQVVFMASAQMPLCRERYLSLRISC
jgi:hypothetical protein